MQMIRHEMVDMFREEKEILLRLANTQINAMYDHVRRDLEKFSQKYAKNMLEQVLLNPDHDETTRFLHDSLVELVQDLIVKKLDGEEDDGAEEGEAEKSKSVYREWLSGLTEDILARRGNSATPRPVGRPRKYPLKEHDTPECTDETPKRVRLVLLVFVLILFFFPCDIRSKLLLVVYSMKCKPRVRLKVFRIASQSFPIVHPPVRDL